MKIPIRQVCGALSATLARAVAAAVGMAVAGVSGIAQAARPLITDDARVVDPGACQVESWLKRNRNSTEFWALPACNATGNLELAFGGARTQDSDGTYATDIQAQAKTLLRPLDTNGWGGGLAVGTVSHPKSRTRDWYAYAPISLSFADDRIVMHANLGWIREGDGGGHRGTWGIGTEAKLAQATYLIAEVFGQDRGRASHQFGIRHWIVPDRVQLDATYGNKAGDRLDDRWFSIGLRLLSPPFLGGFGR